MLLKSCFVENTQSFDLCDYKVFLLNRCFNCEIVISLIHRVYRRNENTRPIYRHIDRGYQIFCYVFIRI